MTVTVDVNNNADCEIIIQYERKKHNSHLFIARQISHRNSSFLELMTIYFSFLGIYFLIY